MYKAIYYNRPDNTIHLWDDENGYSTFPYEKYAYVVDDKGSHTTLTGLKVKKVKSWSKEAEKQGLVFEHDVPVCSRILIDRYYDSDDPSKNNVVLYFDIEVEKGLKYSLPKDADNVITSIAYFDDKSKQYHCLLLDREGNLEDSKREIKITGTDKTIPVQVKVHPTEEKLLQDFIIRWHRIAPNIVTGWNSQNFDIPYLYNRIKNVLGINWANKLSPIEIIEKREYGRDSFLQFAGIAQMDYMLLYKKFTYNEESSYKLDFIAKKELKRGKLEYQGSLDALYKNDVDKFIEYNVNDVELLVSLNSKLDFIEIARGICHAGHVPYDDYQSSSRYLDGALLTYCKQNGFIAFATDKTGHVIEAEGAFVKPPRKGRYKYIYDLDLESEYPNNIQTLNISPETKWGRIDKFDVQGFAKNVEAVYPVYRYLKSHVSDQLFGSDSTATNYTLDHTNIRQFLIDNNLSISSAGILYDKSVKGIIPIILKTWGDTRKKYRKMAAEYHDAGNKEMFVYYDRKQLIQKILLNSLYGVLLLPSFRFYDKENGESTTLTGQSLVQWSALIGNMYYQKQMGLEHIIDFCIYSDTDSVFFESLPLIEHRYPNNQFADLELVEKTIGIAKEMEGFINKSYDLYAKRYHNCDTHTWRIKQEMVGKRAFWGSKKKRYAMWIINKNGLTVDEIEIKGFDNVRSSFPKMFRSIMKEIIVDILHDMSVKDLNTKVHAFKTQYKDSNIFDIMLPTSVKEISKYQYGQKGTPVHVKSAQHYNQMLNLLKDDSIPPIVDGDKIVWAYLRTNPYGFETMALKGQGEDSQSLVEFVEKFIAREQIFEGTLMTKLNAIWEDLGWGNVILEDESDFF